ELIPSEGGRAANPRGRSVPALLPVACSAPALRMLDQVARVVAARAAGNARLAPLVDDRPVIAGRDAGKALARGEGRGGGGQRDHGRDCDRQKLRHAFPPMSKSTDRKSTRLNSSHVKISYAVFC